MGSFLKMTVFLALVLLTANVVTSKYSNIDYACGDDEVLCGDESKCIPASKICDYDYDCGDQSDEEPNLCKKKNILRGTCPINNINCKDNYISCLDLNTACKGQPSCFGKSTATTLTEFCSVMLSRKLNSIFNHCSSSNKSYEIMEHLATAFNTTKSLSDDECPPLYVKIGKQCISMFTPVEIEWPEAKVFCESISGKLLTINNIGEYKKLLTFIKDNEITTRFWIGGYFGHKRVKPSWVWLDGSNIEMGAPFWTVYQNSSCAAGSTTKDCRTFYDQMPSSNIEANCVALNHDYFYYFSNENCASRRSPLCLYNQD